MRYYIFIWAIITLAIVHSCGSDKPDDSRLEEGLPYLHEAQEMALYYSGELRPPKNLTRQISRELNLLRNTWQGSIPGVTTIFLTPWGRTSRVDLRVDDTAFASIMNGQNTAWNELCEKFNLTFRQINRVFRANSIGVSSEDPLHPSRLAELFTELPYVNSVGPIPRGWRPCPMIVRFDDGGTSKHFVSVFCLIETHYSYYYFIVDSAAAHLIGEFSECPPNYDSLYSHYFENFDVLEAIEDSIEQSRPAWVDTARHHLRDLHRWSMNNRGHDKLSE